MNSSSAPKSWTKPSATSAIDGPVATATLSANEGNVRRALSEPSIGSITTRRGRSRIAERDLAALLGDRREVDPGCVRRLELGEDDVLRLAVDDEAAVAALADARVLGPLGDRVGAREELALGGDHPAASLEPGFGLEAGGQGIGQRDRSSGPC